VPNPSEKTSGLAQPVTCPQATPTEANLLDPAHGHNIPAHPHVAGSASRTRVAGSETGGELMHKLIKVVTPS
jgi:hypothetical protein